MKILHVISGLKIGGAEMMLARLAIQMEVNNYEIVVVSLTTPGAIGRELQSRGIVVHALGMQSIFDSPLILRRLINIIKHYKPNVVQTWMYHADLIGGIAAYMEGSSLIVWGVRSTSIPQGIFSATNFLIRICAIASYVIPDHIVCCGSSVQKAHAALHYQWRKMIVIPNGYDFSLIKNDDQLRQKWRDELGYNNKDLVVGVVGRFDPLKDFKNFIAAASIAKPKNKAIKYLMVGRDNEWSNKVLCNWIDEAGLAGCFYLAGQQVDVIKYLMIMDIFCLSSCSEGFPNVVVEAMAAGLPCVVTNAGDASVILDDDNFVVPTKNPEELANKILEISYMESEERKKIGLCNSIKARSRYSINKSAIRYENVYSQYMKK